MTTDYRALCAELLNAWDNAPEFDLSGVDQAMDHARAALAQPEPVGPTDEELKAAYWEAFVDAAPCGADESWLAGLRAIARYARPAIAPIPVSERLPGAEDCDAEGRCWWHAPHRVSAAHWIYRRKGRWPEQQYTHWLPFHALPLPGQPAPTAPAP